MAMLLPLELSPAPDGSAIATGMDVVKTHHAADAAHFNPHTSNTLHMKTPAYSIACVVRYLGPTNHRGSRVKLIFPRWKKSIVIPYDYTENDTEDIALKHLDAKGITCEYRASGKDGETIFTIHSVFTTPILTMLGL